MPRIENARWDHYTTHLRDKYRPPSRGGNTGAWYSHYLTINGELYSFLSLGTKKWVFARDTVSFDWEFSPCGRYRNIEPGSIVARDRNGNVVTRGMRGSKPWRTANTRLPARRSEWKD